jgi:hypothetical protein
MATWRVPRQGVENPLGIGGSSGCFRVAAWRKLHDLEGGTVNESPR